MHSNNKVWNIIKKRVKELNSESFLHLILLPSEMACNFNCIYCYEDKSQKNKMSDEQENIILKLIQKEICLLLLCRDIPCGYPIYNGIMNTIFK